MTKHLLLAVTLLLAGCSSPEEPPKDWSWQQIPGRDQQPLTGRVVRYPIYRARVPLGWTRVDPQPTQSIFDTTKPNVEYLLGTPPEQVTITIHSFPTDHPEQRIPPGMQVGRWRRQLTGSGQRPIVQTASHGGFSGLFFEGEGELKGEKRKVLAWAMQLALEHYRNLLLPGSEEERAFFHQMRADYTIKAVGPTIAMDRHREEILRFAYSFELIQEVPARL